MTREDGLGGTKASSSPSSVPSFGYQSHSGSMGSRSGSGSGSVKLLSANGSPTGGTTPLGTGTSDPGGSHHSGAGSSGGGSSTNKTPGPSPPSMLTSLRKLSLGSTGAGARRGRGSISHEVTLTTLAALFYDPARLVPEYASLIPEAALVSGASSSLLVLRCEMLRMLLQRVDPNDPGIDSEALETLAGQLTNLIVSWQEGVYARASAQQQAAEAASASAAAAGASASPTGGAPTKLVEDANMVARLGQKGIKIDPSSSPFISVSSSDFDRPLQSRRSTVSYWPKHSLVGFGAALFFTLLALIFFVVLTTALGEYNNTLQAIAGVGITLPVLVGALIVFGFQKGTEHFREEDSLDLEFLNLVFHSHVALSLASPTTGSKRGSSVQRDSSDMSGSLVPLHSAVPAHILLSSPTGAEAHALPPPSSGLSTQPPTPVGSRPGVPSQNPLFQQQPSPPVAPPAFATTSTASRAKPPLPPLPPEVGGSPSQGGPGNFDDAENDPNRPSRPNSFNFNSGGDEDGPSPTAHKFRMDSYVSLQSQDLSGFNIATPKNDPAYGVVVAETPDQPARTIPKVTLAENFVSFERSGSLSADTPRDDWSSPPSARRGGGRGRTPRSPGPGRTQSKNLLVPSMQLHRGSAGGRHASIQSLMESSLTDPSALVQQWSNSPVGQLEISTLDTDFFGTLQMKVQLNPGDVTKAQVRMNGSAIHQNMILIGVDDSDMVFLWNVCAVASTGLSVQDAVHKKIDNFLADDFSLEMVRRMRTALHEGKVAPVCRLKLVSLLNCTATVRATATTIELSDGRTHGIAILARQQEEIDKTNNVYLVKYRNAELWAELKSLPSLVESLFTGSSPPSRAGSTGSPLSPLDKGATLRGATAATALIASLGHEGIPDTPEALEKVQQVIQERVNRIEHIAERSTWEYISNVAVLMTEWEPISPELLLAEVGRTYLAKVEINLGKGLPETVECDFMTISGMVTEITAMSETNFKLFLRHVPLRGDVSCIEIGMEGVSFPETQQSIFANSNLRRCAETVCATMWMPDERTIILRFPCSQLINISGSASASSQPTPHAQVTNLPTVALTFILYENKAIFRHNVSTTIWSRGHALCVVDGPRSTERTIKSGLREIHAAIVDLDGTRSSTGILSYLKRFPDIMVFTCGEDDTAPPSVPNYNRKPLTRAALGDIVDAVSRSVGAKKAAEHDVEEQRRIFSTQRSSPWKKGAKLGSGSYADVYEAESVLTGGKMAVKMIWMEALTTERVKDLMNEIDILCKLSHPNIIHYFYCEKGENSVNLFMELCDGGSLQRFINDLAPRPEYEVAQIMTQIVRALTYLHEQGIVHRDIKPLNVLMRDDKVKLSDFGTATKIDNKRKAHLTDTTGTFKYMAPEVILGQPYGTACDIWSLGVIALDLLGMQLPFLKKHSALTLDDFFSTAKTMELPEMLDCYSDAYSFVSLCLSIDQHKRPQAKSLLVHPFLAEKLAVTSVPTYRRQSNALGLAANLPPRRMSRLPQVPELLETLSSDGSGSGSGSGFAAPANPDRFFESSLQDTVSVVSEIMPHPGANRTPPAPGGYVFPTEETPRGEHPSRAFVEEAS